MMSTENPEISQLMTDYQALTAQIPTILDGWLPAPLKPVRLAVERSKLTRVELIERLKALNPKAQGWLVYPDRLVVLRGDPVSLQGAAPLSGDWYLDNTTIRVRQLDSAHWLWVTLSLTEVSAKEATHLASTLFQEGTEDSPGRLRFGQLWGQDALGSWRAVEALFQGFMIQSGDGQ